MPEKNTINRICCYNHKEKGQRETGNSVFLL